MLINARSLQYANIRLDAAVEENGGSRKVRLHAYAPQSHPTASDLEPNREEKEERIGLFRLSADGESLEVGVYVWRRGNFVNEIKSYASFKSEGWNLNLENPLFLCGVIPNRSVEYPFPYVNRS